MPKRIVFIGCREMGYKVLGFLLQNYKSNLVGVIGLSPSQASKTAGYVDFSPLLNSSLPSLFVGSVNTPIVIDWLKKLKPDLIIQVAWSQIISDEIISIPPLGTVGFHASLLPKYRGGSPVNWALIRGETRWGTSMFFMEPSIDNGDIIGQKSFALTDTDTCKTAYDKVMMANISLLVKHLPLLLIGKAKRRKQDESQATYTKRRNPEDGLINWNDRTIYIYNLIRAITHPYPGAYFYYQDKKVYVWAAEIFSHDSKKLRSLRPGDMQKTAQRGVLVRTGDGVLLLNAVQEEGSEEVMAYDYF